VLPRRFRPSDEQAGSNQGQKAQVVGVSTSYAQTLEMAATLKPDVVLLDLLMPDERDFSTDEIKLQQLHNAGCVLAISIWNEPDAKARPDRLGAKLLLDKAELSRN
jgi:chemotaxis response regulator CheB